MQNVGKMKFAALIDTVNNSDDQELVDAAWQQICDREQIRHEANGGMGGWR